MDVSAVCVCGVCKSVGVICVLHRHAEAVHDKVCNNEYCTMEDDTAQHKDKG